MLDIPELRVPRGGVTYPRVQDPNGFFPQGTIIAAGGWCAPSEQLYKIAEPMTDKEARDFWFKTATKYRKRSEKAERKLRKLRKIMEESK